MAAWLDQIPLTLIALAMIAAMAIAALVGLWLRRFVSEGDDQSGQESYVVSAVLGLLALLMGFTLSLSLDRFETRRTLVVEEANAIGTVYLRTQLLPEPHRERINQLLITYLENRIDFSLGTAAEKVARLETDEALNTDLWAAAAAAFDAIRGIDFSSSYLDAMNAMLDLDTSRKAAYLARVPAEVYGLLIIFVLVAAGVLGFVLTGRRRRVAAALLLILLALALTLMLDIDRPSAGWVNEPQEPLLQLRNTMTAQSPSVFDKWRTALPS